MFRNTNHVIDAIARMLKTTDQSQVPPNEKLWQRTVAGAIQTHHLSQSCDHYKIATKLALAYPGPGVLNWYAILMLTTGGLCDNFYDPTAVATLSRAFNAWEVRKRQLQALEWYGLRVNLSRGIPERLIPEISDPLKNAVFAVDVSMASEKSYPGISIIAQNVYREFGGALRFPKENVAYMLSFYPETKVPAFRWYQLIQCLNLARKMPFKPQAFFDRDGGHHFETVLDVVRAINLIGQMVDVPDELLLSEEVFVA
ncbi:hypothetical protein COY32_03905 [candidate division WWE3 bacterium CG_4_10_14_0_2_um_filter_41_14]|uniref:Uncharacterized protein n=1 Tax=candidate division WWE3 bacterium CG_4_10_14_0_2_um_filter_41_14 TaxID=1975072 RepID=A0A2M7TI95_UNCKA|nr:MAG: hypothetical protein COY32_03905 [candidate division WWE3 bacterium CG_4_10_14_0_2_um_filter_41_14]